MISMTDHIRVANPDIRKQCKICSQCDVLLINKSGGIGDILCTRLIFEDLKQVPKIGKITFAVPRKYLPLIKDHIYIDYKMAVEDLKKESYDEYIFAKDITYIPDSLENRMKPNVSQNRANIYADSLGLELKNYKGHLIFTEQEIDFAKNFINQFGEGRKIGIAPFASHISRSLNLQLIKDLVSWCIDKKITPLVFHNKKINIKGAVIVNSLTLREWMAVVSLLDVVVTASTAMFWISQLTCRPTIIIAGYDDAEIIGKYHPNLTIIQRRFKKPKKLYTAIAHEYREIEEFQGDWKYCPCWDGQRCAFKKEREGLSFCLESIQIGEITKLLDRMLTN